MSKLNIITAASLGSLLLASTGACSANSSDASDEASGAKGSFEEIAATVKPDTAAIDLLPADIKKAGVITMAADLHYPPTSFLAEDNKTPIGYNVDIAELLGKQLGLEVEIKNVTWDGVIPGIAASRYDFTATNMSPTPERLEVLDMVTYWAAGSSLIVEKGNPHDLSLTDQSTWGQKIAVMGAPSRRPTSASSPTRAGQPARSLSTRSSCRMCRCADPARIEAAGRHLLRHLAAGVGSEAAAAGVRAALTPVRQEGGR